VAVRERRHPSGETEAHDGRTTGGKEPSMIATNLERRGSRVHTLARALRTLRRCLVCGFSEVRTDEVIERGVLLLHECPRCDHRWTERGLAPAASAPHEAENAAAA
jgi:hypothetical protein